MMQNIEPEKIIQQILLHELELPADYGKDKAGFIIPSVYVFAPNISAGHTDKLQICIQSINSRVLANNNFSKELNGIFTEIKEAVMDEMIQIDIFSRNNDARLRRFEVITALHSIFCKQMQEKYNLKIFQIPSGFRNTNNIEGPARIYRYTLAINVIHKKQYSKTADYYDKFRFEYCVDDTKNKTSFKLPD